MDLINYLGGIRKAKEKCRNLTVSTVTTHDGKTYTKHELEVAIANYYSNKVGGLEQLKSIVAMAERTDSTFYNFDTKHHYRQDKYYLMRFFLNSNAWEAILNKKEDFKPHLILVENLKHALAKLEQ